MPVSKARDPDAASWHFITRNAAAISGAVHRWSPYGIDPSDARQEFVLYLAARVHDYDSSRGKPSTWINHKARGWRTNVLRQKRKRNEIMRVAGAAAQIEEYHSVGPSLACEHLAEISMILQRAKPRHREAAWSVLEGHTVSEVPNHLGKSYQARTMLLQRLGNEYPDYQTA